MDGYSKRGGGLRRHGGVDRYLFLSFVNPGKSEGGRGEFWRWRSGRVV
jgi:hypothetical protein